jgi:putative PEP-CTERM system TPR-repeat lipoprotein
MFTRILASASIVVALWLAPAVAHATTAEDDFVESAQEYYAKGDLPAALIELKNALQANPNNRAARSLLGQLHLDRGDFAGAEKELLRAWDLGLQTPDVQLLLARARLGLGDFAGVLQGTEVKPDASSPPNQDLLIVRGEALIGLGRTREAAGIFQDVLNVAPHARAYAGLARVAFMNGKADDSVRFVGRAIEIDPRNAEFHALAGNIYFASGRTAEAEAAFSRALELDPENLDALVSVARLRLQAKDYAGAKEYIDQALGAGGNRVSVVVMKAYVELALHNYSLARTVAEGVLAGDSRNVTALYVAGVAGFALNETEQARSRLTQYLSQVPEDLHAQAVLDYLKKTSGSTQGDQTAAAEEARGTLLALLSELALKQGASQSGERALEILATQSSDSPRLRVQLSVSKSQSGELSRAEDELSEAIRLDKDKQFTGEIDRAATALILAHIQKRDFEKAIELGMAFSDRRPDEATPYTLMSIAYAEQGDAAKALEAVQKAREKNPDAPELMNNYASLQARLGDIAGAISTLKESIAKNEGNYPTMLQLAALSLRAQDPDQAIFWGEKALAASPDAVEPRIVLAQTYNSQRKYEKTLEVTQGLAEKNPGNVVLLEAIGDAQFNLRQTVNATKTYEALVNAAPYSGAAYFFLARSYLENGQDDLVLPTLRKALTIDPEHYPARVAYARFVLRKGGTDEATPLVESLAKQFSGNPEVQELAGQLAMAKKDYPAAITQLTDAQRGYANAGIFRRSITEDLVTALWRQGDQKRAVAEMEDWLGRNPDDMPMRLQLAAAQAQAGEVDAATEQYRRVIDAQPGNWLARNDFAMLLYGKGDYAAAREHAEIAYQQAGDNPAVLDTLGVVLLADKQVERALPLLEKANAAAPYQPEIALHLSEAYEQSGKKAEARTVLERVLSKLDKFDGREALEQRYNDLAN